MDKMIFYIFKAQGISPEVIHLVRTLIFRKTNIFYSQIRTPRSVVPSCPINFSPHILMNVGSGRHREPSSRVVIYSLLRNAVSIYLLKVNNKDTIIIVIVGFAQVFVHWENPVT